MTATAGPSSIPGPDEPATGRDAATEQAVRSVPAGEGRLGTRAAHGAATLIAVRVAAWGLSFIQNVVVARAVVPRELGLYAMALAIVSLASRAKQIGTAEKLVRDPEEDLPRSLSAAAAVELLSAFAGMLLLAAGLVLIRWPGADSRTRLVVAVLGIMLLHPLAELPAALFHRRLEFRALAGRRVACASLAVAATIAAALAGAQVWSLVIGQMIGIVASAALFWPSVRPRPSPRPDRGAVLAYVVFGLPLWGSGLLYALAERGSALVVSAMLGLSTLGYVHLAQALTLRLSGASDAANAAIYPALRSLATNPAPLRAALERTNRVFALGGIPLGTALGLFAPQWVPLVFGKSWVPAVPFVTVYCLAWGFSAIGYPCYLAFQARGDTRTVSAYGSLDFLGRFILVAAGVVGFGEPGLLVAVAMTPTIAVAARSAMIRRLFPDFSLLRLSARPVAVAAVALAVTVAMSALPFGGAFFARAAGFSLAALVAALVLDRATLRDAMSQIRGAAA
jgi:O-antigen/teichoic acid export membrane protein